MDNGFKIVDNARPSPVIRKLYLASLVALMGAFGMGTSAGYTAMALPDMVTSSSRVKHLMNDKDAATWFGSLLALGALFGGLLAGSLSERIGRKAALMATSPPFTVGWLLIVYADNLAMLYIGRFLTGFCCGMVCGVAPTYIIEMATPEVRGFLGSCFQLFVVVGILASTCVGLVLRWSWLAVVSLLPPVLMYIGLLFMPESPRWLLNKGRKEEALAALDFLHGSFLDPKAEVDSILSNIREQPQGKMTLSELKQPAIWKSFIYSLGLMFFQQFSGANAFVMYTVQIFEDAGSTLDSKVATIIVNAIQVAATVAGSLLADRAGRKILLLISGSGCGVALLSFGIYQLMAELNGKESVSSFGWVPVVSLMMFVTVFSIGYGPLAWVMVAEMVPVRVRGVVTGMAIALNWGSVFIITKTFEAMKESLHDYGTYWFYAAVAFSSCAFAFLCLPETKGKTLEEVQDILSGKKRRRQSLDL